ncbi:MAG TPA: TaqI-like C-terminal specificity domain-containing protein, partial [Ktedonobacteraceae bacterium]|nr:TaqI-like C-terminal specificity domain-containing protein [Ktedonobacteraceae bacterium]
TGRGVELSKTGLVMACPNCGIWRPIPHKQKNGTYKEVRCTNPACGQIIRYEQAPSAKIIVSAPSSHHKQPIIVGEGINRYQVVETRFIDISKGRSFPRCPNASARNPKARCAFCDFAALPFVPGEVRVCKQCGQKYSEEDVEDWVYLGINYKSPDLFAGEKMLVRKTGRGIYATIDRTGAYTNQVVFIFKMRPDRPERYEKLRLSYMLGVLNSRMMLYRYYKALGDIEWKSFPYMTQKTIMDLPIRDIDFTDARQTYFHDQIADLVDNIIASSRSPHHVADEQVERFVRELYGVNTPAANNRIESELERIRGFGSLLGSSTDIVDVEDEDDDSPS